METTTYVLPEAINAHRPWVGCESRDFAPNDNQKLVIAAVEEALASGLFYASDVLVFCTRELKLSEEQIAANFKCRVEGGIFAMECYYARNFIRARERYAAIDAYQQELKPVEGKVLGTLRFNDLKRTTGVVVVNVSGDQITLEGVRGRQRIRLTTDAMGIKCAMDRAAERGLRKTDFESFTTAPA